MALFMSISMQAQQKKEKCTESEFRAKKEAYLKEKAQLTDDEAAKALPIYFELQEMKEKNNKEAWKKAKEKSTADATDEDYDQIIQAFIDVDEKNVELEKEYYRRIKEVLPTKKVYQLLRADIKFNRNMLKIINKSDKK